MAEITKSRRRDYLDKIQKLRLMDDVFLISAWRAARNV